MRSECGKPLLFPVTLLFTTLIISCSGFARTPQRILPSELYCHNVPLASEEGPTWNGLTIGKSTYQEVVQTLAPLTPAIDRDAGDIEFLYPQSLLYGVSACFRGDVLTALKITDDHQYERSLDEWVNQYGNPYFVTWSNDYYSRSVVWPEEGLLATVYVAGETSSGVIVFSPILEEEFQDSWLVRVLPDSPTPHTSLDLAPLPPSQEVEDPWDIGTLD
jgi:hypothetical protein